MVSVRCLFPGRLAATCPGVASAPGFFPKGQLSKRAHLGKIRVLFGGTLLFRGFRQQPLCYRHKQEVQEVQGSQYLCQRCIRNTERCAA